MKTPRAFHVFTAKAAGAAVDIACIFRIGGNSEHLHSDLQKLLQIAVQVPV
jgi:hypothetical protein